MIKELMEDEAVQMYCTMLFRGKHDSRGHSGEFVKKVLSNNRKFGLDAKALRETVDSYIDGGCGIRG